MKVTLIAVLEMDIEPLTSIGADTHIALLKGTLEEGIHKMLICDLTVTARKEEDNGRQMV